MILKLSGNYITFYNYYAINFNFNQIYFLKIAETNKLEQKQVNTNSYKYTRFIISFSKISLISKHNI